MLLVALCIALVSAQPFFNWRGTDWRAISPFPSGPVPCGGRCPPLPQCCDEGVCPDHVRACMSVAYYDCAKPGVGWTKNGRRLCNPPGYPSDNTIRTCPNGPTYCDPDPVPSRQQQPSVQSDREPVDRPFIRPSDPAVSRHAPVERSVPLDHDEVDEASPVQELPVQSRNRSPRDRVPSVSRSGTALQDNRPQSSLSSSSSSSSSLFHSREEPRRSQASPPQQERHSSGANFVGDEIDIQLAELEQNAQHEQTDRFRANTQRAEAASREFASERRNFRQQEHDFLAGAAARDRERREDRREEREERDSGLSFIPRGRLIDRVVPVDAGRVFAADRLRRARFGPIICGASHMDYRRTGCTTKRAQESDSRFAHLASPADCSAIKSPFADYSGSAKEVFGTRLLLTLKGDKSVLCCLREKDFFCLE